ncbi:putative lysine decarboxylase family protein [endosymbiont of Acanthamoeba sp. UWC8]|uniref:LOG family protein n=1 Tax=endosymbiont of Acanthamoeba sp. UWC8 TaxID=86106 RepID=UPI0004D1DE42|nr:TIGR00730 family Rossman fold protein [endosymbiont of Acanthamoeba sp. UWC8]AIF80664.1 putative lysine decarboxylase family protein [endosymbiont of Acanthamoeba sp. UWC8]MBA8667694.1 TIGR00730 family Rossman fold protein [Holosporaceae bacterium 'Namur']
MKIKSVCVFCGARDSVDKEYIDLAAECGKMMSSKSIDLVYGGGRTGMMGAVSKAVTDTGGKVVGIYPKLLDDLEPLNTNLDNTIFVKSMFERKELMIEKSDAFLILPGGFGTLDEIFEVVTLKILKQHDKPIIICNYNNFWQSLIDCCEEIINKKFARTHARDTYEIADTLEDVFVKLGY